MRHVSTYIVSIVKINISEIKFRIKYIAKLLYIVNIYLN